MMIRFKRLLACGAAVIGLTAFGDTVLTQDEDWRGHESEKLTGTIDLHGHNLTISAFPTSATVTDTTGYTDLTVPGGVISVNLPEGTSFHGNSGTIDKLIDNDASSGSRILLYGFKGCKINYDFGEGQSKVVRGFRFRTGNNDSGGRKPRSVVVYGTQDAVPDEVAADKANWTRISDEITGFRCQPDNAWSVCIAFNNETAYRAYRLEIDESLAGSYLELYEMELIENVSPGGELHVVVESGTVENSKVFLTGTLKLVKEGAGTYKAGTGIKKHMSYSGGNEIVGGTLHTGGSWGVDDYEFGACGSSIVIRKDGTLDLAQGQKNHVYMIYLDGGRIIDSQSGYNKWYNNHPMLGYVYLEADATMESTHSDGKALGFCADAAELWLNGHTLDLTMTGSYLKNLTVKSAGVINLHGVCEIPGSSGFCDLTMAKLNAYGTLYLNGTLNLGDYINYLTAADSKNNLGTGKLYVHGRFKPVGDGFRGCTLKDGATLDLSGCTGTWDTKSKSTQSGSKEVFFEDGATITLDAGERTFENGEMIVSWTTPPQNVTFTPVADLGGELTPLANGLVLIAAGSVATEWTGNGDGKTWSQDANWSRNAPEVNGTAAFNQGAGTLDFDKGFILDLLTIGADAGAFTHAGTETLGVQSAITNLSAAAQAFSMPMALGKSGEAFQVHTVGALTITSGSDTCAATELVKTGAGELTVDDLVVHTAKNVTVDEGALHIIPTSAAKTKTDGTGAIRVADGAQLLLDANNGGDNLAVIEPTRGKTVYIAGDGGDGRGAIYNLQNMDSKGSWAGYLSRLVLTDDASIGGGHIGIRPLSSSGITDSRTEGPGALTVKTVQTAASGFTFHTTQFALGGLVNAGLMQFQGNVTGTITNGVRLANGSSLELKGEQTLALGDGAFDGTSAVKGGVGTWRSFTKTGDGVLTYQSSLGASTLDVRGGGVVLDDVSESTVALQTRGLVVGHKFFPSYAAGWQNLTNSTETYVHAIETQLSAANDWYAKEWSEYEGEEYGPCLVVVYSGYLNVSSPTNEVWSFIGGVASASRLLIGDEEVFLQPNTSNAAIASRTMTPGLHKFQLRLFYQGYNHSKAGGAPAGGPSATPTNVVKVSTVSVGFQVDKLGRGSNVLADYKLLSDTAGETFRWGSLADDPVLVHPLTGESVTATLQAPFRAFSAAPGTTVTSLSSATRIFETLAGFTDFAGADVEIRTAWTVDGADLASADACFATAEAVAFGEGAELRLVNPNGYRGHGKTFTVMTAEKGIAGLPSLVVEDGSKARWALGKSADGKSLVLTRIPPGLTVTVR